MRRRLLTIAALVGLCGVFAAAPAHAQTRFSFQVGVGAPMLVAPYDDSYWQPGYSVWTGVAYRWVPGAWVRRGDGAGGERWDRERTRGYDNRERRGWEQDRNDRGRRDDRDREWRR
jgi:hypothetical protein